jgi:hypothetical protein
VDWLDVRVGLWLVAYLVAILVVSAIGSKDFGGANWIPAPWDSVLVAVIGLAATSGACGTPSATWPRTRPRSPPAPIPKPKTPWMISVPLPPAEPMTRLSSFPHDRVSPAP